MTKVKSNGFKLILNKSTFFILLATLIASLSELTFQYLILNYIEVESVANISLTLNVIKFLTVLGCLGTHIYLLQSLAKFGKYGLDYLKFSYKLTFLVSISFSLILVYLLQHINLSFELKTLLYLSAFQIPLRVLLMICQSINQYEKRYKRLSHFHHLPITLKLIILLSLVAYFDFIDSKIIIWSINLSLIIISLYNLAQIISSYNGTLIYQNIADNTKKHINNIHDSFKNNFKKLLPYWYSQISSTLYMIVPLFVVSNQMSLYETGLFAFVLIIIQSLNLAPTVILNKLFQARLLILFENDFPEFKKIYFKIRSYSIYLAFLIIAPSLLFYIDIITFLFNNKYELIYPLIYYYILFLPIKFTDIAQSVVMHSESMINMKYKILNMGVLFLITSMTIAIPLYGLLGAFVSYLISDFLVFVINYSVINRTINKKYL